MNINIVAIGKIKESFYRDAIAEYAKRLSRFCKFNIYELPETLLSSKSDKDIDKVKTCEGKLLLAKAKGFIISLDLIGKMLTSPEIGELISKQAVLGVSEISFLIGGSYGLSDEVKQAVDYSICFGRVTYPHQLMRVILTEQIYRAFMINDGSEYHK